MNLYKNSNIIHNELKKRNIPYKRIRFSRNTLRRIYNKYPLIELTSFSYCCLEEEESCWTDIEGIDYGWEFRDYQAEEMPDVLFNLFLNSVKKFDLYKRKFFMVEEEDAIYLILPLRDWQKCDYVLTFKKTEAACGLYG